MNVIDLMTLIEYTFTCIGIGIAIERYFKHKKQPPPTKEYGYFLTYFEDRPSIGGALLYFYLTKFSDFVKSAITSPCTITLNFSPQNAILYSQGDAPPYMCGSRNNWRCPSLSVAVLTTGELQKARLIFYEVRMLKLYAVQDEYIRYLRVENNIIHVFDNKEGHRTHDSISLITSSFAFLRLVIDSWFTIAQTVLTRKKQQCFCKGLIERSGSIFLLKITCRHLVRCPQVLFISPGSSILPGSGSHSESGMRSASEWRIRWFRTFWQFRRGCLLAARCNKQPVIRSQHPTIRLPSSAQRQHCIQRR